MNGKLWEPTAEDIAEANITRFAQFVAGKYGCDAAGYESLWQWSIDHREAFWTALWDFCDVRASRRWEQALVDGEKMPGAGWFVGARLNFAENLLRRRDESPAIIAWNERGPQRTLSFLELYRQTARLAQSFRNLGLSPGDRVAAYMPNVPETIVAMLAAASIGAAFSSCSPDFGVQGVLDRFGQIEPKLLIAADGYCYADKEHDCLPRLKEIAAAMPTVERTIVVGYRNETPDLAQIPRAMNWADAVANDAEEIEYAQLPFDHPLYILFSSGTTGVPKCIVHGAGGTLLQHFKEHVLHTDLAPLDRLFYFTTCGWMMWNWLVSGLAAGATLVLYDGSPFHPRPSALFDMAQAEKVNVFGTSAKYLSGIEKAGLRPAASHDLSSLRAILSTGSPLLPESFDYVYRDVKPDVHLASISGGTDIVSSFVLGNPALPVYRGEIQCRGLGMDVAIFADEGKEVVGQPGELVCRRPFPSMPVGFWNDPDGAKYRAAYFERFAGVWHHGDWAELTPRGGTIIHGRSDAVLNPGGVRIGTAEIYRQVEKLPEVLESIVVGQEWEGDVRIVLFVRLREGAALDDALEDRIRRQIRADASPRHVPARILAVTDIPRTKSGKIVELAVREVIHGRPVKNLDALANPESLEEYRDRPELTT